MHTPLPDVLPEELTKYQQQFICQADAYRYLKSNGFRRDGRTYRLGDIRAQIHKLRIQGYGEKIQRQGYLVTYWPDIILDSENMRKAMKQLMVSA